MSDETAREMLEMLEMQKEQIRFFVELLGELGFDPRDMLTLV